MKFNISRPPRHQRKQDRINAKREWHIKFAWLPTSVDETRETHSRVWFEKYWRQGHYGPSRSPNRSPILFTKYSEKTYFKKKLNGDFDKGESDNMVEGSAVSGTISAPIQSVSRAIRTAKYGSDGVYK